MDDVTAGNGQCSLREAIIAANTPGAPSDCGMADALSNTIVLGAVPYPLTIKPVGADDPTTGDLDVKQTAPPLTITGAGTAATSISGATLTDRILHVLPGAVVTLQHLTVRDAHAPDGEGGVDANDPTSTGPTDGGDGFAGGGIQNGGTLTLTDVAVLDNTAGSGGKGGTGPSLNTGAGGGAGGAGGGIENSGTLHLTDVTASGNRAGAGGKGGSGGAGGAGGQGGDAGCCGDGGGVHNSGGTVTISDSTFTGNHAGDGGQGGGGGDGVGDNSTGGKGATGAGGSSGGGVASNGGTVSITNTTLVSNAGGVGGDGGLGGTAHGATVPGPDGGGAGNGSAGGAVFATGGAHVTLLNVTVDGNTVGGPGTPGSGGAGHPAGQSGSGGNPAFGGGVYASTTPAMTLINVLMGTNELGNCAGQVVDGGHNLSFGNAGCPATFAIGDPKLRSLADNGGPTQTKALGPGSAALDKVPATGSSCPSSDQRGVHRPVGPSCDIGAYEVAPPAATTAGASAITAGDATVAGTVTANAGDASVHFDFGPTSAYGSQTSVQHVAGVTPSAVSAAVSNLTPSTTYHYRVVATTIDGTAMGSDQTFTTGAPEPVGDAPPGGAPPGGGGPPGGGAPPGGGSEPTAPSLGPLRVSPSAFAAAARGATIARKRKTGTTISYTDSQAATTTFVVRLGEPGVRKGRRCVKPPGRTRGKHLRSCTREVSVGSFVHKDGIGRNSFHFTGRVRGRKLKVGRYRLAATPRANGANGKTVTAGFRVIR